MLTPKNTPCSNFSLKSAPPGTAQHIAKHPSSKLLWGLLTESYGDDAVLTKITCSMHRSLKSPGQRRETPAAALFARRTGRFGEAGRGAAQQKGAQRYPLSGCKIHTLFPRVSGAELATDSAGFATSWFRDATLKSSRENTARGEHLWPAQGVPSGTKISHPQGLGLHLF